MKKEEVNYPALVVLLGLFVTFFTCVAMDKQSVDEKQKIIEEFESDYGYIPKYEVQIK